MAARARAAAPSSLPQRPPITAVAQDYYSQAGALFRGMSADQRALLVNNIAGALKSVPAFIQERQLAHFLKADTEYGVGVRKALERLVPGDPKQVPVTK